jgi:large subunit ribosomal protein L30
MKLYAVVRLRGQHDIHRKIRDTLKILRLHKKYHCVIVPESESYRGMLQIVKDYVAYGELNHEILAELIRNRGRLSGNRRVTDEYVKEKTGYENIDEFAKAVFEGKAKLSDLEIKPVFRLHPPRGGLRNIKWHFQAGGELGYQGENINALIYKMR